jgi:hypothetical protein
MTPRAPHSPGTWLCLSGRGPSSPRKRTSSPRDLTLTGDLTDLAVACYLRSRSLSLLVRQSWPTRDGCNDLVAAPTARDPPLVRHGPAVGRCRSPGLASCRKYVPDRSRRTSLWSGLVVSIAYPCGGYASCRWCWTAVTLSSPLALSRSTRSRPARTTTGWLSSRISR